MKNKQALLKDLTKLANKLDEQGKYKIANALDSIIRKNAIGPGGGGAGTVERMIGNEEAWEAHKEAMSPFAPYFAAAWIPVLAVPAGAAIFSFLGVELAATGGALTSSIGAAMTRVANSNVPQQLSSKAQQFYATLQRYASAMASKLKPSEAKKLIDNLKNLFVKTPKNIVNEIVKTSTQLSDKLNQKFVDTVEAANRYFSPASLKGNVSTGEGAIFGPATDVFSNFMQRYYEPLIQSAPNIGARLDIYRSLTPTITKLLANHPQQLEAWARGAQYLDKYQYPLNL